MFPVAGLTAPGLTGDLVLFRQSRIEHSAKLHIAGMPPSGDDESFLRLNAHIFVADLRRNSENSPCRWLFSDDTGQLMPEKNFNAFCSRALFQSSHDTGTAASIDGLFQIIR